MSPKGPLGAVLRRSGAMHHLFGGKKQHHRGGGGGVSRYMSMGKKANKLVRKLGKTYG